MLGGVSLIHDFIDQINGLNVTFTNGVFRLILSMVLGVIVGAERKRKGQVAGMRTFSLISMGAAMAMLISIYVPQEYFGLKNGDPGRIAAQVITGVGFLGGGAMIHLRGAVRGLTTAAGIWMISIVGMAVGVGMYGCAIIATLLSIIVLQGFDRFDHWRKVGRDSRVISVKIDGIVDDIDSYKELFKKFDIHLSTFFLTYNYQQNTTEINFMIQSPLDVDLTKVLPEVRSLHSTQSLTLSNQS